MPEGSVISCVGLVFTPPYMLCRRLLDSVSVCVFVCVCADRDWQARNHRATPHGNVQPGIPADQDYPRRVPTAAEQGSKAVPRDRERIAFQPGNGQRHAEERFRAHGRNPGVLPGGQDEALLRRHGKTRARHRRPVFGQRRSVEMQRLSRMRRCLRTGRIECPAPQHPGADRIAVKLRVPQPVAKYRGAFHRRRDPARR